jgi:hypothetical protein
MLRRVRAALSLLRKSLKQRVTPEERRELSYLLLRALALLLDGSESAKKELRLILLDLLRILDAD